MALGLNFAVSPKRILVAQIIAATEFKAHQLDYLPASQLRICVSNALRRAEVPKSNLDKEMRRAVRSLRDDNTIIILSADIRNVTMVLDWCEYDGKLDTLLSDINTHRK